ncbi:MAG TPA: HAMP domain-containing histidine kinase [Epsilonproteobacteria bacterium]|nr:HAMP domain-containing histidine kinase [Campylobacterota bacterium]
MAHMKGRPLNDTAAPTGIKLAWINTENKVVKGTLVTDNVPQKAGYFRQKGYDIFVSDAPREHLGIKYVVAQSNLLSSALQTLKMTVLTAMIIAAIILATIAWLLSKLFMKPVHQRVVQIERFINDVTHELNTPITSLSMASNQALKIGECTSKTLNNISISTKQLYDIYRSLTYLNFSSKEEISEAIKLDEILEQSIGYYTALAEIKRITFVVDISPHTFVMPEARATLLFGNLISNAIKYSSPKSNIYISLKEGVLRIRDEGIGIEEEKQKEIFEKFTRGTEYSGGFGVGLSIVKSICDTYGIEVEVNSIVGEGTEFILSIP